MTIRREDGFTLVELLVALVVFSFAIVAATSSFLPLVNQFKQQSKISETQMESLVGLEILRRDIENAGFGLPWYADDTDSDDDYTDNWPSYSEANATMLYAAYDDDGAAPRGILLGNDAGTTGSILGRNKSDYLVIKSVVVSTDKEAQKWTYIYNDPTSGLQDPHVWFDPAKNLAGDTKVILIRPSVSDAIVNVLVLDTSTAPPSYYLNESAVKASNFAPYQALESYLIYGIASKDPTNTNNILRMPFNRADYFISTTNIPSRCAAGTGVLVKAPLQQDGTNAGKRSTLLPLLDCVADMQVIVGRDTDDDGVVDTYSDSWLDPTVNTTLTAQNVRDQVREVRIYILAQEGQKDPDYNYLNTTVAVGEFSLGHMGAVAFDFAANGITDYNNYRWKVYRMVIRPENLNPKKVN